MPARISTIITGGAARPASQARVASQARPAGHVEADNSRPSVELTLALAGEALHHRGRLGQEGLRCQAGGRCRHSRQEHLPLGGFELQASRLAFRLDYVDHVNPVRQGCVQRSTEVGGLATAGKRDLEVFGLAR